MNEDNNLELLRELVARAAPDGTVELDSSEVPFALTGDGMRWLKQLDWDPLRYRLTAHGRAALR